MFEEVEHLKFFDLSWSPNRNNWYCLHCISNSQDGNGWAGVHVVRNHVEVHHKVKKSDQEEGTDYTDGKQLVVLLMRYQTEKVQEADRLAPALRSLVGATDFLFECGEDVA